MKRKNTQNCACSKRSRDYRAEDSEKEQLELIWSIFNDPVVCEIIIKFSVRIGECFMLENTLTMDYGFLHLSKVMPQVFFENLTRLEIWYQRTIKEFKEAIQYTGAVTCEKVDLLYVQGFKSLRDLMKMGFKFPSLKNVVYDCPHEVDCIKKNSEELKGILLGIGCNRSVSLKKIGLEIERCVVSPGK